MSKKLSTAVEIDAPLAVVWRVLTDLPAHADWDPFLVSAAGEPVPGARLTLTMQPVGGRTVTVRPVVQEADGRRLRWRGRLGIPGLLDADHLFVLDQIDTDRTRLRQQETFRGVLTPLLARSLDRGTLPAFELMNQALKQRAEEDAKLRR